MQAQPFELYLIRHGVAAERGENYPDDTKRPLTNEGVQKLRKEAKALVALDITLDVILTSPLVRTRQTAEARRGGVPQSAADRQHGVAGAGLARTTPSSKSCRSSHRRHHIALVGHEPGIGELAGRLIGLRRPLEFKKGAICRIDVAALPPAGPGQLRWFLTPRICGKSANKKQIQEI